jgi:hypothetical protein
MSYEGKLQTERTSADYGIASMSDWYDMKPLSISGESGSHIGGGYLVVSTKWEGCVVKGFHNAHATTDAAIIVKTAQDSAVDKTIRLASQGYSPKLPAISHIKVTGTSDDLIVFLQKR